MISEVLQVYIVEKKWMVVFYPLEELSSTESVDSK